MRPMPVRPADSDEDQSIRTRPRLLFPHADDVDSVLSYAAPEDGAGKQAVIRLIERLGGQRKIQVLYERARIQAESNEDPWTFGERGLGLTFPADLASSAAVPREGPLVVVANHPFGIIDGLALCRLVSHARTDLKVVAMSTLWAIPELRRYVLPINFAPTPQAASESARSRAEARRHLKEGGCLVIFPAGAISSARRPFGQAIDGPWHPFVARLIMANRTAVLPVRFFGQNSRLFQMASLIHPTLRLGLLMGETVRRIGTRVDLAIGDLMPYSELSQFSDPRALMAHLRAVTYGIQPPAGATLSRAERRRCN